VFRDGNHLPFLLVEARSESFIHGFRLAMTTAVMMALASALSAFMMIQGKKTGRAHQDPGVSRRKTICV
jgi:hypothetical protein